MLTFAVGDIHGCLGYLDFVLDRIGQRAAGGHHRIVCLGDYIDRGPDSAGVIARLRGLQDAGGPEVVCLKGNHEDLMLRAVEEISRGGALWLDNGGRDTLDSFGARRISDLPPDVVAWAAGLPTFFDDGRRYFVHAGLNPALDIAGQRDHDRLWIREAFLDSERDFGRFVVHGHTPRLGGDPDLRPRRVNLDTAAVYGGRLTAAIFTDEADGRPGSSRPRCRGCEGASGSGRLMPPTSS